MYEIVSQGRLTPRTSLIWRSTERNTTVLYLERSYIGYTGRNLPYFRRMLLRLSYVGIVEHMNTQS